MNRDEKRSGARHPRSGPPRKTRRPLALCTLVVAAFTLVAQILVSVHGTSHLAKAPADATSRHCALCSVGDHSAGLATNPPSLRRSVEALAPARQRIPIPPAREAIRVSFARAPPSFFSLVITG